MTRSKDIILFSTADWDNPFWTNKQHTASILADRGYRILYIESLGLRKPTGSNKDLGRIIKRLGKGLRGLRNVKKNIWVYSPLIIPAHQNPLVSALNKKILTSSILRHAKSLDFRAPLFWTYNPLTVEFTGIFNESLIIYHCVDDLAATPGMPVDALVNAEKALVQKADIVFTTHPNLQRTRSKWNPENTFYFPNVADYDHFSKARKPGRIPDDLKMIPGPRIGFIGAISDYKLDFELISNMAKSKKDWHWVFIGKAGEGQPGTSTSKLELPNIHMLGPRPYETLPDYLRGFDVAIIPSKLNEYTTSMFPMKFFEYLSAGKPVVATNLPALKDYTEICILADSAESFITAIEDILAGKIPDPALCSELAEQNTWQTRTDSMLDIINRKRQKIEK